jgi:hypothetical protein
MIFEEWHALIHSFVSRGSMSIKVNDNIGRYFQTQKDHREGDPLYIVDDMLAVY